MFTGMITAVGRISRTEGSADGLRLEIDRAWDDLVLGESIAVDGACLTVTAIGPGSFAVEVVSTTIGRTAFAGYVAGRRVNLERALAVGERLGGHLVQGHVDGIGTVLTVQVAGNATVLDVAVPAEVADVSIPRGSVTVDGVSLTINAIPAPGVLQLALIPFTLLHTTLGERRPGDAVHVEGDTVGKYVRQFTEARRDLPEGA
ncbi:MAG: riboflavin synthase [Gemmatimonadota bacterium]